MIHNRSSQISIGLVCLLMGILLSVQFQTTKHYKVTQAAERAEDLTSQIKIVAKEKQSLEQQLATMSKQIQNSNNNGQALDDLRKDLQKAELSVGLVAVEGPGIVVTLNDNSDGLAAGDDPNDYLIHDQYLLMVINELRAGGAGAISNNNQRIIAMTEIRCAGTLINVNRIAIGPPFTIKAIGNPDVMYGAMTAENGELEYLNLIGVRTSVQKSEKVSIPASNNTIFYN